MAEPSRRGALAASLSVAGALFASNALASEPAAATPLSEAAPVRTVDAKAHFGAKGDGVTDDFAALQRAFNSSTLTEPAEIVLPSGTYRTSSTLTVPFAPGTRITGAGSAQTTVMQSGSARPIIRFAHSLTHSVTVRDMTLEYAKPQTDARSAAVQYSDSAEPSASWFRHRYENLTVKNAYDGFVLAGPHGNQTIWESIWRDVTLFRTRHSAFSFAPAVAAGQPSLTFENVGIFNTAAESTVATGPAFDLQAAEALLLNADIEGWTNEILSATSGGWIQVQGLHVESHRFSGSHANMVSLANGTLEIDGFSISGTAASSVNAALVLFAVGNAGRLALRHGTHVVQMQGKPYVNELFWSGNGRGDVSVIVENVRRVGGSVHQPGTGSRASETAAMMTASGILPDGRRGFSAPYGGAVYLFSPNGTRFAVSVTDSGQLTTHKV